MGAKFGGRTIEEIGYVPTSYAISCGGLRTFVPEYPLFVRCVLIQRFLSIHTFIATRVGTPRNFRRRTNCARTRDRSPLAEAFGHDRGARFAHYEEGGDADE